MLQVFLAADAEDAKIIGILGLPSIEALQVCCDLPVAGYDCDLLLEDLCMLDVDFVQTLFVKQFRKESTVCIV